MAVSLKKMRENAKATIVSQFVEYLTNNGEDVGYEKANKINYPIVLEDGTEDWVVVTISIPTGANKGTEPYDGYSMREDFEIHLKEKTEKAKKSAEAKAKKIERDKKVRERKIKSESE